MQTVSEIAKEIVAREGGYVNDPDDPGGETNYGVTLQSLRRLGLDITGDGRVDGRDLRALTKERAQQIFVQHYFERPNIAELPASLQASVFDMYVNSGANAVKILQRLLRQMRQEVVVDGVIGPQTVSASQRADAAAAGFLCDAYGIARRNYYYRLADARPKSRKFARRRDGGKGGWIRRAETFIDKKYHLSEQEHRERVSSWG
jgi:lysozyme family protein